MGRHLAWAEMRIFMARFLWAFDFQSEGPSLDWTKLKTYVIIQKERGEGGASMGLEGDLDEPGWC